MQTAKKQEKTRTQWIKEGIDNGEIAFIDESEIYNRYDDMLNDIHGTVNICGLEYDSARALKELDETAYNTGFNDWIDGEDLEEYDGGYVETNLVDAYIDLINDLDESEKE